MSHQDIVNAIEDVYAVTFSASDVSYGKYNFRGFREVFVGSQYAGYIHPVKGFVGDSKNWERI